MRETVQSGKTNRWGASNELIGIAVIGVTLAGLMLATWSDVRSEIRHQGTELRSETRELRMAIGRLDDRLRSVEIRLGSVDSDGAAGDSPSSGGGHGA